MTYTIIEPGKAFNGTAGIQPGECRIDKGGTLTLREADLKSVGVVHFAVVMVDAATMRIALRAPRSGEEQLGVAVQMVTNAKKRETDRRRVRIIRAIQALKVEPAAVAGRYAARRHDDLLEIDLYEARAEDLPARGLEKAEPR